MGPKTWDHLGKLSATRGYLNLAKLNTEDFWATGGNYGGTSSDIYRHSTRSFVPGPNLPMSMSRHCTSQWGPMGGKRQKK